MPLVAARATDELRPRGAVVHGMTNRSELPVTQLLVQWREGNASALAELTPLLYEELRRLAQRHLRGERHEHTLQRTALVHEAFLRLVDQHSVDWRSRGQFFALASRQMRRILVDHARARLRQKRGGGAALVSLDELLAAGDADPRDAPRPDLREPSSEDAHSDAEVSALDEALVRLAEIDPQQAAIVEMRWFGGLSNEETAAALSFSTATVKREWAMARAWLQRELAREDG